MRRIRIIFLTTLGALLAWEQYNSSAGSSIFEGIIFCMIGLVGLLCLIWSIIKDYKEYVVTKKWTCYFPTFIGLVFVILILSLDFYQDRKMNAKSLLSGYYDGGFNGFSIDLKEDGTYIMSNGSGFGEYYFYGTYAIKDSIITIDKSNIDNVIISDRLVIRSSQYFLPLDTLNKVDTTKANYFTQIDKDGKEINPELRFRVTSDNRTRN